MTNVLPRESLRYLQSQLSVTWSGWLMLLIGFHVYTILTSPEPYPHGIYIALLESLIAAAVLLHRGRWLVYILLLVALVIHLFTFTHIISEGAQDSGSTRDDAVEVTTSALLHGENAWNANPGVPATTGPTSILLAVPFVSVFGKINWLSFGFWLALVFILLWYDIRLRNNTWIILSALLLLGWLSLEHTMYWSLEELYYPLLLFPVAYTLAMRKQEWGIGALAAVAIWSRLNYVFLWIGFSLWYLSVFSLDRRRLLWTGLGFLITSLVILLPFVLVGGQDLLSANPWIHALGFSMATWPKTNFVFHALNQMSAQFGVETMRWLKLVTTLILVSGAAWRLNAARVSHPFWHIAVSAFVAHTVFWLPAYPWSRDYALMFVLPAMLGISMTPTKSALNFKP